MPTFAESHLVKCVIPNIVSTLKPDIVIFNEGLFPLGPENGSIINQDFIDKYCEPENTSGWDFGETAIAVAHAMEDYPHINWILGRMEYPRGMRAEDAYTYAVSNFSDYDIDVNEGDIIFPMEPDAFHLESDVDKIDDIVNALKPDQGVSTTWLDFMATQNYIEKRFHPDIQTGRRSRRFAVCYGSMEYYKSVVMNFVSQNYSNTELVDLTTYHYPWFRTGKYMDMKLTMLRRQRLYWHDFMQGHNKAIEETKNKTFEDEIVIRPNSPGNYKYIKYIDIEHPLAIQNHECFIK